ncbi:hypothetical protein WR25_08858 [Diploscapter pachys]|uniref:Uncharacterized protein n=1 Tax=Diploscapter pachys TaxID=2018661 RepID=A0A2A2JB42_9BILA|nr:hypothetical protein WR25_08858 [Diploscapter pachys]
MLVFSFLSVGKGYDAYRHQQSYVQSSLIGVIFSAAALAYAIFFVRETHFPNKVKGNKSRSIEDFREKNEGLREEEKSDGFFTLFLRKSTQYLASLAEVLKVKRPGYTRCCILLSLIFVFFEYLAFDSHLILLYVKRPPFSWSDRLYSNFHLAESILTTIGMVLCPFLLSFVDWLGKDNLMIISGLAASAVSFFVIAFAHSTAEIFAMLSIIMGFCPSISAFIFNNLFNYSLSFWAGFPFFVAGILVVLVLIGQTTVHFLMRPQWKLDRLQKVQKAGSHITLEYRSKAKDSFGDLEKTNRNVSK